MKIGKCGFVLFLSAGAIVGCGDSDGNDAPVEDAASPVGGEDAGTDAGEEMDSGTQQPNDAGSPDAATMDGGALKDAGKEPDAKPGSDAKVEKDASEEPDTGRAPDTGTEPDAAADAGSGEPSAACVACEQTSCKMVETLDGLFDYTRYCADLGDRVAGDGPGQGRPKRELCEEYLTCARRTGCADGQYGATPDLACFCGELATDDCIGLASAGALPGPCALEALTAAETMELQDLFERSTNYMNYALGAATYLLQCDLAACADECYAPCTGKANGTVCGVRGAASDGFLPPGSPDATAGTCQAEACVDNHGALE